MGRKPLLNADMQEAIIQAINLGATRRLASQFVGIDEHTFMNWMKWGEEDGTEPYLSFFTAVVKAEGRAAVQWLAQIEQASRTGTWQAAAWKLERKYPHEYGRSVVEQKHTGQVVHAHAWIERLQQSFDASQPAQLMEPSRNGTSDDIVDVTASRPE